MPERSRSLLRRTPSGRLSEPYAKSTGGRDAGHARRAFGKGPKIDRVQVSAFTIPTDAPDPAAGLQVLRLLGSAAGRKAMLDGHIHPA